MKHIEIETNTRITFHFMDANAHTNFCTTDDELYHLLVMKDMQRKEDYQSEVKPELKQLHIALSRAVEEGDQLKIGIVLGQTISKLETLINQ